MASFIKHFAGKPLNTTKFQVTLTQYHQVQTILGMAKKKSTNQYRSVLTHYHTASMVHWLGSSFVVVLLW